MRRAVVMVLLLVVLLVVGVLYSLQTQNFEAASAEHERQMAELESAKHEAETPAWTDSDTTSLVELTGQAAEAGAAVAEQQNQFAALYDEAARAGDAQNGAPNDAMIATAEHRRELTAFFDERLFLVEDDEAYNWTTATSLGLDQIDPRFEWYVRYDGNTPSSPESYAWSVETAMASLTKAGTAEVVWTCRDADGAVLAWANSTFDEATGLFTDLTVVTTSEGGMHQPEYVKSQADETVPELEDLMGEDSE